MTKAAGSAARAPWRSRATANMTSMPAIRELDSICGAGGDPKARSAPGAASAPPRDRPVCGLARRSRAVRLADRDSNSLLTTLAMRRVSRTFGAGQNLVAAVVVGGARGQIRGPWRKPGLESQRGRGAFPTQEESVTLRLLVFSRDSGNIHRTWYY